MKGPVLSAVLIIVGILLLGLVISLQMTILSDREAPFGLGLGSVTTEVETSRSGGSVSTAAAATSAAVAMNTPRIVIVQPTPTASGSDAPAESVDAGVEPTPTVGPPTPEQAAVAMAANARGVAISAAPAIAGDRLLAAHRITTSSDDHVLVDMVSNDPFAVGFVSHATFEERRDLVRSVALPATDGRGVVQPETDLVTGGVYPLSYPLYLYTSAQMLRSQPEVATFVGCYLSRTFTDAELVGLFPPAISDFAVTVATFTASTGLEPTCNTTGLSASTLSIMTASSLIPLTQRIGGAFRSSGYPGGVEIQTRETRRSAQLFCEEGLGDVIAVSRALYESEIAACERAGRELVSFEIAKDALTVVVSRENDFLTETNLSELQLLFADGDVWANVHVGWPNKPIARAVPSDQSGGFAKFVETVFDANVPQLAKQVAPATATTDPNAAAASAPAASPEANVAGESSTGLAGIAEIDQIVVAGVQGREECTVLAGVVAQVLQTTYGKSVSRVTANDTDELFDRLAWDVTDAGQQVDISPCYTDLDDRAYLREKGSKIAMMHNIYGRLGDDKLYMIAHSSVPPILRSEDACLYEFFRHIAVEDMSTLRGQNPTEWLAQHGELVDQWTSCEQ